MRILMTVSLAVVLAGCVSEDEGPVDGQEDDFLSLDGKADGLTLTPGEVAGVLAVANTLDGRQLRQDASLASRPARNIPAHRAGADKQLGTTDDDRFDSLRELDRVPYVGPSTLRALLGYAHAHDLVDDGDTSDACARVSSGRTPDGQPALVCEQLHASAPRIRPPADSDTTLYLGLYAQGAEYFYGIDRKGRYYILLDQAQRRISFDHPAPGLGGVATQMQSIYQVKGRITTTGESGENVPAIVVTSLTPYLMVPGKVIDGELLGAWEAELSLRTGENTYSRQDFVRARFLVTDVRDISRDFQEAAPGGEFLVAEGVIDNWTQRTRGSDGRCLEAIGRLGARSPFFGASGPGMRFQRDPNMHGRHDEVVVVHYPEGSETGYNGMGGILPLSPSAFLQEAPAGELTASDVYPHGTPNGHAIRGWHKVSAQAGSQTCQ